MIYQKGYVIQDKDIILDDHPTLHRRSLPVELPLSADDYNLMLNLKAYVKNTQQVQNEYLIQEKLRVEKLHKQGKTDAQINTDNMPRAAIGIAAPQVNISKRMFYICLPLSDDEEGSKFFELGIVNPVIYKQSLQLAYLETCEGCLSVDKIFIQGHTLRSNVIWIKGYDVFAKKEIHLKKEGMEAIVFQHEYDHINGTLFVDKINPQEPFNLNPKAISISR